VGYNNDFMMFEKGFESAMSGSTFSKLVRQSSFKNEVEDLSSIVAKLRPNKAKA